MSLFKVPKGVAKIMEGIQARFLWGNSDLKRKIHMVCWSKIKQCKQAGGLGVRGIKEMNDALLLKWWWRFGTEKESLWRKVICAKYNMDLNSWLPNMETNRFVSNLWRDVLLIKCRNPLAFNKFMENLRLTVGDGNTIKFWTDPWVNGRSLNSLYPRIFNICPIKDETIEMVLRNIF